MKAEREHRVPLAQDAIKLLKALPRFQDNPLVFPAARGGQMSDMTLSAAMKRLHQSDLKAGGQGFFDRVSRRPAVPHGLRSTFRDWVAERTQFAGDMAEVALAHRVSNAVEAAYRRGDMVEKRRVMMDAWAAFLSDKAQEKKSSEVELTNCKALEAWRLAEELSVCDATVLICGGDPSTAFSRNPDWELEPWEDVEFEGFDGVFKALIAAIRGNKIPARLAFKAYDGPQRPDANFSVVFLKRDRIENNLDNDPFFMLADGDTWEAEWADKLVIENEPLWDKSMVDVEDLKRWLSSRGLSYSPSLGQFPA